MNATQELGVALEGEYRDVVRLQGFERQVIQSGCAGSHHFKAFELVESIGSQRGHNDI
jgi:hypothetical protein